MRKLSVFNSVTVDGYFTDQHGDMSWAHRDDPEWNAFAAENSKSGGLLLFGRITYEMMAGFWPTPAALKSFPDVAAAMNNLPKVVFSRTMSQATWQNTTLLPGNLAAEVRKLKSEPGPDMVILGSGTIVSQLAQEDLIDDFQIVVVPIVLGKGRTMFDGVQKKLSLQPTTTRTFGNGNILINYQAAAAKAEAGSEHSVSGINHSLSEA